MDLDLNTILLIIIALGLAYMIYNKQKETAASATENTTIIQGGNRRWWGRRDNYPYYPYYGYGYRRYYW